MLSKLIYNSIIDIIEGQLSPSNIGARRNRSPRDHLFVVYAVVNETVHSEHASCKDLVFTDFSQCFDSLWTEMTLTDLFSNGVQSNILNLIHELSKSASIVIKTPVGETEKGDIEDIIMQGETLSSILCTSTMDTMAKDSKAETIKYRNEVSIPKLRFVDDILDINECGDKIKKMHNETVEHLNKRKLQINKDKSVRIHVPGKKSHENCECEELLVDSWSLEKESSEDKTALKDVYNGKSKVKTVEKYDYLGNTIENDGSNKETINDRTAKGQGVIRDIIQILEGCFFGDHFLEALIIMRNSKLMSVLTYNVEIIHNISKNEIDMLDRIDLQLLRKSMMLSRKSTRCLILLEPGLVPVEYLIKQKRINFLFHLLTSDEDSISKKVLEKQILKPINGDFVNIVKKDLGDFNISLTYEEMKSIPKKKFKEMVKKRSEMASFERLLKEKEKVSKGKDLHYEELRLQDYLTPGNNLSISDMRKIFQVRKRDISVRANFPNAYKSTTCQSAGCDKKETQEHVYTSGCWNNSDDVIKVNSSSTQYKDVFTNNVQKRIEVTNIIFERISIRNKIIRTDGPLDSRGPNLVIRKAKKKVHTKQNQKDQQQ